MKSTIREARVDLLVTLWHKIFGDLLGKASKNNDKLLTKVCKNITRVPKSIQRACLTTYVNKCIELYKVNYYQWRIMFPSEI